MTLTERVEHFKKVYKKWQASWPWLVTEQGRDVLYAVWVVGNDYRNKSRYYGAYPAGYLERVMALFPDIIREYDDFEHAGVLQAFSGSLPPGRFYTRLDVNPDLKPDVVGSVYDAERLFPHRPFKLVLADPPYSAADAVKYRTPMIDRRRTTSALAGVVKPGGHLVWLDTVWPIHRKDEWLTVGRILLQRSTNHRARVISIFERTGAVATVRPERPAAPAAAPDLFRATS